MARYDLTVLATLAKLPLELRQLLSSRQRAKLRGEQVMNSTITILETGLLSTGP